MSRWQFSVAAGCPLLRHRPATASGLTMASSSSSNAGTAGSCVHKRVSANNAGAAGSCLHKRVSSRELSGTTKFKKMSAYQRFSHFRLAAEHDTHDPVRGLPRLNKLSIR